MNQMDKCSMKPLLVCRGFLNNNKTVVFYENIACMHQISKVQNRYSGRESLVYFLGGGRIVLIPHWVACYYFNLKIFTHVIAWWLVKFK